MLLPQGGIKTTLAEKRHEIKCGRGKVMHFVQDIQFLERDWQIVGGTAIFIVRKWSHLTD